MSLSSPRASCSGTDPGSHPRPSLAHFDVIPPPDQLVEERRMKISEGSVPTNREFCEPLAIREEDVRDALHREAQKHSCWKTSAAQRMEIVKIEPVVCLHYILESFTESRSTTTATEPYSLGQFIDRHGGILDNNFATVDPWEYDIKPSEDFVEKVRVVEMPRTTNLAACSSCNTEGITHCFHCRGYGTDKCSYCRGTGMKAGIAHPAVYTHPMVATYPHADLTRGYPGSGAAVVRPNTGLAYGLGTPIHFMAKAGVPPPGIGHHDLCYFCHGRGIRECHHCKGKGKKPCATCGGSGSVRSYTKLKVKFAVEKSEFYYDQGVPDKLIAGASGETIFSECSDFVLPLRKYEIPEINEQSRRLCTIHLQKTMGACRILKQRHSLEAVPVANVTYSLNGRQREFWVYGQERSCYIPRYPSRCVIL